MHAHISDKYRRKSFRICEKLLEILNEYGFDFRKTNIDFIYSYQKFSDTGFLSTLPINSDNVLTQHFPILKKVNGKIVIGYLGGGSFFYAADIKEKLEKEELKDLENALRYSFKIPYRRILRDPEIKDTKKLERALRKELMDSIHLYESESISLPLISDDLKKQQEIKIIEEKKETEKIDALKMEEKVEIPEVKKEQAIEKKEFELKPFSEDIIKEIENYKPENINDYLIYLSHSSSLKMHRKDEKAKRGYQLMYAHFVEKSINREEYLEEMRKIIS